MSFSRADKSRFAEWSFTIDRTLLTAFLALVVIGLVLSFAASPAVAMKKGFDTYYFVERHVVFAGLAVARDAGRVVPVAHQGVRAHVT